MINNQKKTITQMLEHNQFCTHIITANEGKVIKELGDAVLAIFPSTATACKAGFDIIHNLRKCGKGICTKVVVTAGDIERIKTRCEPDIYGTPVNLCNRMSKYASADSVLIEESRLYEVQWLKGDPKINFCKPMDCDLREFGKNVKLRKIALK